MQHFNCSLPITHALPLPGSGTQGNYEGGHKRLSTIRNKATMYKLPTIGLVKILEIRINLDNICTDIINPF